MSAGFKSRGRMAEAYQVTSVVHTAVTLTAGVVDPFHQRGSVVVKVLQTVLGAHDINTVQVHGLLTTWQVLRSILARLKQV